MFVPRITDSYTHYWAHQAYAAFNYREGLAYCALCGRTSSAPPTVPSAAALPPLPSKISSPAMAEFRRVLRPRPGETSERRGSGPRLTWCAPRAAAAALPAANQRRSSPLLMPGDWEDVPDGVKAQLSRLPSSAPIKTASKNCA